MILLIAAAYLWRIVVMPGWSYSGPLAELGPEEIELRERLQAHVDMLAGTIGERHFRRGEASVQAQQYLVNTLQSQGHIVSTPQMVKVNGIWHANLQVEIAGVSRPSEILILGAHYDSVPGCPAANDNGSGVAALLEISRMAAGRQFSRTVRFVAFFNEEGLREGPSGSYVYAEACRSRNENIVGMISLETIGYFTDAPDSQVYPKPFGLFYPTR